MNHALRRTRAPWIAILAVCAVLATSCGSGRSDSSTPDTGTPGTEATTGVTFGDMASPCGPAGDEGTAASSGVQGVTADTITIGYGDDAGYQAAPGLNHEMSDAVTAMIDWCNDQGGINGRTVEGVYYDAKITEAGNVMTEACSQVFMLVGQGFALDGAAEQTRVNCGLPSAAGYATNAAVATGPGLFQPDPTAPDLLSVQLGYAVTEAFPEAVKHSAVVYGDFATTQEVKDKALAGYPEAGWTFVGCDQPYPLSGPTWQPIVQRLKDCGVEVVYFTGSPAPNFENLLDAAAQADYHPVWVTERNFYEEAFAAWNQNGNADDVYVGIRNVPFDQADSNPAVRDYIDIVTAAGGDISLLGSLSASAFLMWAQAAKDCGADLTRECVVENLTATTTWDAGGLHAPSNPGDNRPSECAMVLRMQGTEYQQWSPEEVGQFACDPKYVVEITTPAVTAAKLGPDRRSTLYTTGG